MKGGRPVFPPSFSPPTSSAPAHSSVVTTPIGRRSAVVQILRTVQWLGMGHGRQGSDVQVGFFLAHWRTTADVVCHLRAQKIVVFCLAFIASSLVKVSSNNQSADLIGKSSQRLIGCSLCFRAYLASSYFLHHYTLFGRDFQDYLAQEFGSSNFCEEPTSKLGKLRLPTLQRRLSGEGSHRRLISTLSFMHQSDIGSLLDSLYCEGVIIERLPVGVFADPFELQHLVRRKVFLDAAVFGDTNLELPSALSNRTIVEIHMSINLGDPSKGSGTVIELPLHARYPPLNESGFAEVGFWMPDLFLRCRPKISQAEACSWTLIELNAGPAETVMWHIPAGKNVHRDVVSSFTFVSALVCALSIVVSTLFFSTRRMLLYSRSCFVLLIQ